MILRVGEKVRHLMVLDGYRLLDNDEAVEAGDKVANIRHPGWMEIEEDDVGLFAEDVGDFVIRKQVAG